MCGIAGFFRHDFRHDAGKAIRSMGKVLLHRGPDGGGEFMDDDVALAHRRLSIIDLSPLGTQPMISTDQRYVIAFNGEIYNFPQIRKQLEQQGRIFKSRTDTEVILALYASEGEKCLDQLNGMFAFAIWDRRERSLFLARDRVGKKPLYFYHDNKGRFAFASELKSILQLPVEREIQPTAIVDYLKYLYIPPPGTIYQNIFKLNPGHCMRVEPGGDPRIREYWDIDYSRPVISDVEDAAGLLLTLVGQSISSRMIADVPLGAFLSGGIDSSAIVALMSNAGKDHVRTCTIGFPDEAHDERKYAREVARLFDTNHTEYVVEEDLASTVTVLPRFLDEPFADSSAIPTYHVSRLARKDVTVALAGDGGDENFGGYQKYLMEIMENRFRNIVPSPLLTFLDAAASCIGGSFGRRAHTLARSARLDPGRGFYLTNTFIDDDVLPLILSDAMQKQCAGYDPACHTLRYWDKVRDADHITAMLYTDIKTYLPGDILVKVDRMSMAHSLEVRAPLLDYRIVEFAASLPSRLKIHGKNKKYILKKSFSSYLPEHILNRKKHGFTVPLDHWFRYDLKELAECSLLNEPAMAEYFSPAGIRRIWQEHQQMRANHGTLLWTLLSFALWHREYM